jgi:hypothetical protein
LTDLFSALEDEQTYLEASEGIRSLVGRIVVSPAVGDHAELCLEGDLAAILSLAAGRKIPAGAEDSKILQSMSSGEAETLGQKRKNRPQGAVQADAPEVLISLVAGARNQRYQQFLCQTAA